MVKICKWCGAEYQSKPSRYCSSLCYRNAKKNRQKKTRISTTCLMCGEMINNVTRKRKFCDSCLEIRIRLTPEERREQSGHLLTAEELFGELRKEGVKK